MSLTFNGIFWRLSNCTFDEKKKLEIKTIFLSVLDFLIPLKGEDCTSIFSAHITSLIKYHMKIKIIEKIQSAQENNHLSSYNALYELHFSIE